jgi:hypothetical protein
LDRRVLRQIHCTGLYEQATYTALAIPNNGLPFDIPLQNITMVPDIPFIVNISNGHIIGKSPGDVTITAIWNDVYTYTIASITVSSENVLFTAIYTNQLGALHVYQNTAVSISVFGTWFDTEVNIIESYGWNVLQIIPMQSVLQTYVWSVPNIIALHNSYEYERIQFTLPLCESISTSYTLTFSINLQPFDNDVDIGNNTADIALDNTAVIVPFILHAKNISAFIITFATSWSVAFCFTQNYIPSGYHAWQGTSDCSTHDPLGYVTVAGVGPFISGDVYICSLMLYSNISNTNGIIANITFLNSSGTFHQTMIAGNWKQSTVPYWTQSKDVFLPLQQLRALWNDGDMTTVDYIIAVLLNKQRYIYNSIAFATDFELSLLIQLVDLYQNFESNVSKVVINMTMCSTTVLPEIAFNTSHYDNCLVIPIQYTYTDGWWGIQLRQYIPPCILSITYSITTYDDLLHTEQNRKYTYQSLAVNSLSQARRDQDNIIEAGNKMQMCPRIAHTDTNVIVELQSIADYVLPYTSWNIFACNLHIPISRLQILYDTITRTYTLNISIESLLRAYDIRTHLSNFIFRRQYYLYTQKTGPSDPFYKCPQNSYFSTTTAEYVYLLPHSHTNNCYDYECEDAFVIDDNGQCIAQKTEWYWTVIIIIIVLVAVWALIVIVIFMCMHIQPKTIIVTEDTPMETQQDPMLDMNDPTGALPISISADNNLEFEVEYESSLDENSESDLSDNNEYNNSDHD